MNHLPPIKLHLATAEMEMLHQWLDTFAARQVTGLSEKDKMIVSVLRELLTRFTIPPYSVPKNAYTRKLKYHEAYWLHEILRRVPIEMNDSSSYYLDALRNGVLNKINKQL